MEKNFKRILVTTALPYANGRVHIGHLAGVYVPADIYTRYQRLKGRDVILIGGSDEHGVPITLKARKEGVTPQDIVDRYHTLIKKSFEEFGISFDIYSRTTSKIHEKMASDFSVRFTTRENLSKKRANNITMKRPSNFSPTDISPVHVPIVKTNMLTVTNARPAVRRSMPPTSSIPNRPSAAVPPYCGKRNTGTCRSTVTKGSCDNGFSKDIPNGNRTCTDNANRGSIWACNPVP